MVSLQLASMGLLLLIQWSAGQQHRPNSQCTDYEQENPDSIRLTARGFTLMQGMGKLYMKMWDANEHENTKYRCIRMKVNVNTQKYQMSYIDINGTPRLLDGWAQYRIHEKGVALDFHNGLSPNFILQTGGNSDMRFQIRDIKENELMVYACYQEKDSSFRYQRYDASYYFNTWNDDRESNIPESCRTSTFANYFVPNGAMDLINQAECEALYVAGGGDQITLV